MPESVRRGEQEAHRAFQRYVLPEIDVLLRVATSITRDPVDAEDLVQDTLLRAFRAIEAFDGGHPRAWLLTIMRNAQRNRTRRRHPELLQNPDAVLGQVPDRGAHAGSAEGIVMDTTFDAAVEDAFRGLPERSRKIVRLVDIDGLSYQEAARVLGVPMGTVMSRLHRGRRRIREHLGALGVSLRRRA